MVDRRTHRTAVGVDVARSHLKEITMVLRWFNVPSRVVLRA